MKKEKTWKQCYRAHERRMWVTGVGLPAAGLVVAVLTNQEAHETVSHAYQTVKWRMRSKIYDLRNKRK